MAGEFSPPSVALSPRLSLSHFTCLCENHDVYNSTERSMCVELKPPATALWLGLAGDAPDPVNPQVTKTSADTNCGLVWRPELGPPTKTNPDFLNHSNYEINISTLSY